MSPAWIVCAWPPLTWQAQSTPQLRLVHLHTLVEPLGEPGAPCRGQTLWATPASQPPTAGLAWDWVQMAPGVYVLTDPMGLITNLQLVSPQGELLSVSQMALYLNELVRQLPWQAEVQRTLQQSLGSPGLSAMPPRAGGAPQTTPRPG
jgi:hypothetical protein